MPIIKDSKISNTKEDKHTHTQKVGKACRFLLSPLTYTHVGMAHPISFISIHADEGPLIKSLFHVSADINRFK